MPPKFKPKTYKSKYFEYTKEDLSKNDQLSDHIDDTIAKWKKQGYEKWTKPLSEIPRRIYIHYIAMINGKPMIRLGGLVAKNSTTDKYLVLLNTILGRGFSVQYSNLTSKNQDVGAYYKPSQVKARKTEKRQAEKRNEQEAKRKRPKTPPPTVDDYEKVLKKVYYGQGNYVGRDKLYSILQDKGHDVPRRVVEKWLHNQTLYQLTKPATRSKGVKPIISKAPYNIIEMDLAEYDKNILLNVIDVFTRFAWTEIVKDKKPKTIIEALKKILRRMEKTPKLIISDNGREFKNKTMAKFLEKENIKQLFGIAGNPQGQGIIERFNQSLKRLISKSGIASGKALTSYTLQKLTKNYNNMEHSTIQMKPVEAFKEENHDAVMKNTAKRSTLNLDKDVSDDLEKGDTVRIALEKKKAIGKRDINWTEELYTIHSIRRNKMKVPSYRVKDSKGEVLKGYIPRSQLQKIEKSEGEATVVYEIEKLLKVYKKKNKEYALVKWKGYPESEATEKPATELRKEIGRGAYDKLKKEVK